MTFLLKPHQVSIYCCRQASLDSACPCAAVSRGTGELSNLVLIDLPAGRLKSPGFHFLMDYGILNPLLGASGQPGVSGSPLETPAAVGDPLPRAFADTNHLPPRTLAGSSPLRLLPPVSPRGAGWEHWTLLPYLSPCTAGT